MIAERYLRPRRELETALARLLELGAEAERPESWLEVVHALARDISDPLLVVVIGESRSGKSTLLSALLDHDLSAAGIDSANEHVSLFKYGVEEKTIESSPRFRERHLPLDLLRDFNILETPGTDQNATQDRQLINEVSEQADLVLIVLSVTNPWRQVTLDFAGALAEPVLKNAVFVLQQSDLREAREIEIVQRHLEDVARQKIGFMPPMFPVSARDLLRARDSGSEKERLRAQSQLGPLHEQINLVVGQSGSRLQKLRTACQIAQVMVHDLSSEFRRSVDAVEHDEARVSRVNGLVQLRKEQTLRHVNDLLRRVEQTGKQATAQSLPLLQDKLGLAGIWKTIRGRYPEQREFELAMDESSRQSIEQQIEETVQLLESDLRAVWPQLHDLLDQPLASGIQTELSGTPPDFARQRRELLQSVRMVMSARPSGSNVDEPVAELFRRTALWLQIPAGLALLAIAAALLAVKFNSTIAAAAVVLAVLAIGSGGALAFYRRKKLLRAYHQHAQTRVAELVEIISWQFNDAIDSFHNQIAAAVAPLAAQCAMKRESFEPLLKRAEELQSSFMQAAAQLH